jgi:hypothetical protein
VMRHKRACHGLQRHGDTEKRAFDISVPLCFCGLSE